MNEKYQVTTSTAKVAWRRDPDVPAGQPALGSFACPCGATVGGVAFGDGGTYPCACGRTFDSRGWIIGGAS